MPAAGGQIAPAKIRRGASTVCSTAGTVSRACLLARTGNLHGSATTSAVARGLATWPPTIRGLATYRGASGRRRCSLCSWRKLPGTGLVFAHEIRSAKIPVPLSAARKKQMMRGTTALRFARARLLACPRGTVNHNLAVARPPMHCRRATGAPVPRAGIRNHCLATAVALRSVPLAHFRLMASAHVADHNITRADSPFMS